MRNNFLTMGILFLTIFFGSQVAFSGTTPGGSSHAVHTMAAIMAHLNHYPSDSEKETLRQIVKDGSTTMMERSIANAIIGLQHKASDADKKTLYKIMKDNSASKKVRVLAGIIYSLNHQPTAADIKKLKNLMK